jgi:hypothetical protein
MNSVNNIVIKINMRFMYALYTFKKLCILTVVIEELQT